MQITDFLLFVCRKRARDAETLDAARRANQQHYYNSADQEDKEKYQHYGKYHVPAHMLNNINLYAARNMEMRPLPPVPKSPGPSVGSGEYNTPHSPTQHEYNTPTQNTSGDGVFGVPSPHSGDFCTMPLPGRSGAYPQLRPQRRSSGDILEYPEENTPHYFELDPDGLPLPPPPESLLNSRVDVAPVHKLTSPCNNNTRKHMANGIALPGMHPKTPEQENRENFGRESMTSQRESGTSQHEGVPQFEYHGVGYPEEHVETGNFSWP